MPNRIVSVFVLVDDTMIENKKKKKGKKDRLLYLGLFTIGRNGFNQMSNNEIEAIVEKFQLTTP
jgi:hypothetical protein